MLRRFTLSYIKKSAVCLQFQVGKNQDECLAACNDQINNVGVTSSQFPNRETFVKREEFCITFMKLNRTCASAKRPFLTNKFPNGELKKNYVKSISDKKKFQILYFFPVCEHLENILAKAQNAPVCPDYKWDPVRQFKLEPEDPVIYG